MLALRVGHSMINCCRRSTIVSIQGPRFRRRQSQLVRQAHRVVTCQHLALLIGLGEKRKLALVIRRLFGFRKPARFVVGQGNR